MKTRQQNQKLPQTTTWQSSSERIPMTPYEQAIAMIAMAEQTYIEDYYGDNVIALFTRNETPSGTDADSQHCRTDEG